MKTTICYFPEIATLNLVLSIIVFQCYTVLKYFKMEFTVQYKTTSSIVDVDAFI